jgi:Ricin-type beta-trefoil lectin domain
MRQMTGLKRMNCVALIAAAAVTACGGSEAEGGPGSATHEGALMTSTGATTRIKSAINTAGDGKCMDVASGQTSIGTPIVQFRCHGGTNQQFELADAAGAYKIVSKLDRSKCVGFSENFADSGVLLRLVSCDALQSRWYMNSSDLRANPAQVRFMSALGSHNPSGRGCVDVASGLNWDSLWLQVYDCHNGPNQQWTVSQ